MSSTSSFSTPSLAAMLLAGAVLLLLLGLGVATDDVQELDDATVFAVEEGEEESEVANAEEGEDEEKEQWSDWLLFEEFDEEMDMDMDSEADVEFLSEEEDEGASISTSKVPTVPGQRILTKYEMAEKNTFQHKGKERLPVCIIFHSVSLLAFYLALVVEWGEEEKGMSTSQRSRNTAQHCRHQCPGFTRNLAFSLSVWLCTGSRKEGRGL